MCAQVPALVRLRVLSGSRVVPYLARAHARRAHHRERRGSDSSRRTSGIEFTFMFTLNDTFISFLLTHVLLSSGNIRTYWRYWNWILLLYKVLEAYTRAHEEFLTCMQRSSTVLRSTVPLDLVDYGVRQLPLVSHIIIVPKYCSMRLPLRVSLGIERRLFLHDKPWESLGAFAGGGFGT